MLSGRSKKALRILAGCLGGFFLAWLGYALFETNFYRRALPEQLEITGLATTGSDFNPLLLLVPMRHEACGAVVFQMSQHTVDAIAKNGAAFFETARQGRGYSKGHPLSHYYSYEPWQETPLPSGWIGDGIWSLGLHCARLDRALVQRMAAAAREPGSYYTTKSEAQLVVIPRLKLIVFTYFG